MKLPWGKKEDPNASITVSMTSGGMSYSYGAGTAITPAMLSPWNYGPTYPAQYGAPGVTPTPKKLLALEERSDPVYGWRGWNLDEDTGNLRGVRNGQWQGRTFEADCSEGVTGYSKHQLEMLVGATIAKDFDAFLKRDVDVRKRCIEHLEKGDCTCGVYGRASLESVEKSMDVYAHCLAYGTVAVDGDGNFRASDVQIEKLYLKREKGYFASKYIDWDVMAYDLSFKYGVPCELFEELSEIGTGR